MSQLILKMAVVFFLGFSGGILFTLLIDEIDRMVIPYSLYHRNETLLKWEVEIQEDFQHPTPPPINENAEHGPIIFNDLDALHKRRGDEVAQKLAKNVRVLCWVMTQPSTLKTKGQAVKDTWGKRCNVLVFMSSKTDKEFPAVGLDVPEGRANLWLKTRAAWKYVYDKHLNDADWFIKADDDSFVILENLRYFLSHYNTSQPNYFGRYFKPFGGYNSGGAGYVFSKRTLVDFVRIMKDPLKCKLKSGAEDVEVGVCLQKVNTHPGDTRDELGRETFHPFTAIYQLIPAETKVEYWIHKYNKWEFKTGPECCSDHSITFHYVQPNEMYEMEYFIYHLHPFGVHHIHD